MVAFVTTAAWTKGTPGVGLGRETATSGLDVGAPTAVGAGVWICAPGDKITICCAPCAPTNVSFCEVGTCAGIDLAGGATTRAAAAVVTGLTIETGDGI